MEAPERCPVFFLCPARRTEMTKMIAGFLTILALCLIAVASAFAGSSSAPALGRVNVPITVPKATKSACQTIGASRAGYVTVDTTGTSMMNWDAKHTVTVSSAGTAEVVKRKLGANTVGISKSSETSLPIESAVNSVKFERYSGATTITVCSELN